MAFSICWQTERALVKHRSSLVLIMFELYIHARRSFRSWSNALMSRAVLADLPGNQTVSFERDVIPQWVGRGLYGFPGGRDFIDIGNC